MFKRIDRRRKRKEAEETLGLDEGERGVFGLHDTDSSESDTDSSESASASSSSSATSSDQHGTRSRNKRKRGSSSSSPSDESGGDEDGGLATDDEEVEDDQNSDRALNPTLTLTIRSALREPVRLIRLHPEAWVCAFCPGRILKHATMVKVHEASRVRTLRTRARSVWVSRLRVLSHRFTDAVSSARKSSRWNSARMMSTPRSTRNWRTCVESTSP
jgi:hypothetical protein